MFDGETQNPRKMYSGQFEFLTVIFLYESPRLIATYLNFISQFNLQFPCYQKMVRTVSTRFVKLTFFLKKLLFLIVFVLWYNKGDFFILFYSLYRF